MATSGGATTPVAAGGAWRLASVSVSVHRCRDSEQLGGAWRVGGSSVPPTCATAPALPAARFATVMDISEDAAAGAWACAATTAAR